MAEAATGDIKQLSNFHRQRKKLSVICESVLAAEPQLHPIDMPEPLRRILADITKNAFPLVPERAEE